MGDSGEVRRLVSRTVERFGRLDCMVSNAAVQAEIPFMDLTEEEFDRVIRVNLKGTFLCGQTAARQMLQAGTRGTIINMSSVNAVVAHPVLVHYAASKGGIGMLTKGMAVSLAPHGIRVNGIGPDLTQSPQVDYGPVSEHDHMWESWAPVGRLGWPEDQARVALFLASDMSAYVTGHNIPVDGGTKTGGGWFWSPTARRFTNRPTTL